MDMKKERLKRKLNTYEVAGKLKVSPRTVESWESGLRNPSMQIQMLVKTGILDK